MIQRLINRFNIKSRNHEIGDKLSNYGLTLKSNYLDYFIKWIEDDFKSPAPLHIKWTVLNRWRSGEYWIETGTLWGETTEFLSNQGFNVITIEPSKELASLASQKFEKNSKVQVWNELSEDCLNRAIASHLAVGGLSISFWLDGHYSGEGTHKGPLDTPIMKELETISGFREQLESLTVFVDDIRLFSEFNTKHRDYPTIEELVKWSNFNKLSWTIEQDIFIATNNKSALLNYVNN